MYVGRKRIWQNGESEKIIVRDHPPICILGVDGQRRPQGTLYSHCNMERNCKIDLQWTKGTSWCRFHCNPVSRYLCSSTDEPSTVMRNLVLSKQEVHGFLFSFWLEKSDHTPFTLLMNIFLKHLHQDKAATPKKECSPFQEGLHTLLSL